MTTNELIGMTGLMIILVMLIIGIHQVDRKDK